MAETPKPPAPFRLRLVSLNAEDDASALYAAGLHVDRAGIETRLAGLSGRIGAIPSYKSNTLVRASARRLLRLFARDFAPVIGIDEALIHAALFFHAWTQLCALMPLRHLARKLLAEANGRPVLIELPSLELRYLNLWDFNELEPLIVYAEILRRDGRAFLIHRWQSAPASEETIELRFSAGAIWSSTTPAEQFTKCPVGSRRAIVTSGMRGIEQILRELAPIHSIECIYSVQSFCDPFLRDIPELPDLTIPLRREGPDARWPRFSSDALPSASLFRPLGQLLQGFLPAASHKADELVARHGINELHCCDHHFLESAILAHAVKKSGGRVVLWPHSANPCHFDLRRSEEIDAVHCVTRSGAELWKARLPKTPVVLRPHVILPQPKVERRSEPVLPLTVVVIGGAHVLSRLPLLDFARHRANYRDLFARLRSLDDRIDLFFRPKPAYEDEAWLGEVLGYRDGWQVEHRPPPLIENPNLVFVAVSFASTALLEGIARGIPGMTVRDFVIEEYIPIPESTLSVGPAAQIVDEIRKCLDAGYRDALVDRQLHWFRAEIDDGTEDRALREAAGSSDDARW